MSWSADTVHVKSRSDLLKVADRMATAEAPQAPLYAAAATGKIALIYVGLPDLQWPADSLAHITRPAIVLVAGDPGYGEAAFEPGKWNVARNLRRWGAAAIIHGAAAKRDHYAYAVAMAGIMQRVAFIECPSDLVQAWRTFLAPLPTICIVPEGGGAHPVPPEMRH